MNKIYPVYYHSSGYAAEFNETEQYRTSYNLNLECRDAITEAINRHYQNNRLSEAGAHEVIEQFGFKRTMVILANTVLQKDWDGRFSSENRNWAHTVLAPCDMLADRGKKFMIDRSHSGLVDLFITQVRREYEQAVESRQSVKEALKKTDSQALSSPRTHLPEEKTL